MTHAHIATWVIAIILFFVAHSLLKSTGKEKAAKIVQMVLRVFYILIIVTGVVIASGLSNFSGEYIGKIILGILTIGMMEMVLAKTKKGKSAKVAWILFILVLVLTILLGMRLPLGIWSFS